MDDVETVEFVVADDGDCCWDGCCGEICCCEACCCCCCDSWFIPDVDVLADGVWREFFSLKYNYLNDY